MLGIDLGTTNLKAALVGDDGTLIAEATAEYPTAYPRPNWVEQSPDDWWAALCTTTSALLRGRGGRATSLAGVCISSQAPAIVPVDAAGRPLMPAMIWLDKRAEAECDHIRDLISDDRLREITYNNLSAYLGAPTYVWLKRHRRDVFDATHQFLMANGYLNYHLTGRFTLDVSQAPLQLLYDVRRGEWSAELLDLFGLPAAKYPPIYRCDAIIGEVTSAAAEATGIPVGTPVLAGVTDTPAAMLGMGIARAGQAFVSHGTGCNIGLCATDPRPNRHLVCIPHALPGRWMLDAVMTSTGASMKWFVNTLCAHERDVARRNGDDPYQTLTRDVAERQPGSGGLLFLPYLIGEQAPVWDADARAAFVGISADTTRDDLLRALMEGVAFGVRQNLEIFEAAGWSVSDIRVQGGAARNPAWNQILSDVTRRTVLVPPASAGAPIGDALLVGLATGVYPDEETALAAAPAVTAAFHPDADAAAAYDALYPTYTRLYDALRDTFSELARFRDRGAYGYVEHH